MIISLFMTGIGFPPFTKIRMSTKADSRKKPPLTRARDNRGTEEYPDLPTEEVWVNKHDSSKEQYTESSVNMAAALPESNPGKTNFSTSDLKSMAISCARSKLKGGLNFFRLYTSQDPYGRACARAES